MKFAVRLLFSALIFAGMALPHCAFGMDDEPTITEMADPDDRPAVHADAEIPEENDLTQDHTLDGRGAHAEINFQNVDEKSQNDQNQQPEHQHRPDSEKEPQSLNTSDVAKATTDRSGRTDCSHPIQEPAPIRAAHPADFNMPNILISSALFGAFSWINNHAFESSAKSDSFHGMLAQEFVSGAQQSAAANIAQQLIANNPSNSAAFCATFMLLHAGEVMLKKITSRILGKTNVGKKIAERYQKLSERKRAILGGTCAAASWSVKALLARIITK